MESLTGTRIVTLATNLPGPLAAARLTALGAEVIKIEPPAGDALAAGDPAWYRTLVARQNIRTVDLKTDRGRADILEFLAEADVLLTASRPLALARLGLSWPELTAKFPRLCQVAIVGHSSTETPGHDLTYQAAEGLIVGAAVPRIPVADLAGAERAFSEVCLALLEHQLHGTTSYREVSLADAAARFAEPLRRGLTAPGGILGGGSPEYRVYAAREGHVAVACLEPHFRRRLLRKLGADCSHASLANAFRTKTASAWEQWARSCDLPIVRVATEPCSSAPA